MFSFNKKIIRQNTFNSRLKDFLFKLKVNYLNKNNNLLIFKVL